MVSYGSPIIGPGGRGKPVTIQKFMYARSNTTCFCVWYSTLQLEFIDNRQAGLRQINTASPRQQVSMPLDGRMLK